MNESAVINVVTGSGVVNHCNRTKFHSTHFYNYNSMVHKVLLIGSGLTGAIAGNVLRKICQKDVYIVIWDKARGIGGRMSTSRSPNNPKCIADLGAQYVTVSPECMKKHGEFYSSLLQEGLLQPLICKVEGMKDFPKDIKHFVAPCGMSSLVKYFLADVADEMHFQQHLSTVHKQDNAWLVETQSGVTGVFDVIILTMPVPQILQLQGNIQDIISSNKDLENNLKAVKYTSRYALGLFFDENVDLDISWGAKYFENDAIFRYASIDNKKRNKGGEPAAVVFHTSVKYGENNIDKTLQEIEQELLTHVKECFPRWPQPLYTKCQRWRYSQVLNSYSNADGFVVMEKSPLLVAGGDGFTSSFVDGCILSGISVANAVASFIKSQ